MTESDTLIFPNPARPASTAPKADTVAVPPPPPGEAPPPSLEEVRTGWNELSLRARQLEAELGALKEENKGLRFLLERAIEHRQKSHGELVMLLTGLVSKLPINDVGVIVSRLVEHNTNVGQYLAALIKGATEDTLPKPTVLKTLEHTKRDLLAALKPLVDELIQLDSPFDPALLESLVADPDQFFAPATVRANRCFVKGLVPKERIMREFGDAALPLFNDLTTDPKLNPRPKPDEIVLGFKSDFDSILQQQSALPPEKRQELLKLNQRVQKSKASTDHARQQRNAFQKLSFMLELLHFYENQSTEAPDVMFAQRLPALIEQLAVTGPNDPLDEKLILQAEALLAHVISTDHRLMVINNLGKSGGVARTLRYVLRLRTGKTADLDEIITEFVKHLIPPLPQAPPQAAALADAIRFVPADLQRLVVLGIMSSDRLRKSDAEALGKAAAELVGMKGIGELQKAAKPLAPEIERKMAWEKIKDLISRRTDPVEVAAAFRDRLHQKYDADELRQSWVTLTEADAISLIRIFCQLPYLGDGRTDPIARPVMETYVSRLLHEKYASTYQKVSNSLRNMYQAKPDSPTLLNFMALVRWTSPEAANKICADIGMPAA